MYNTDVTLQLVSAQKQANNSNEQQRARARKLRGGGGGGGVGERDCRGYDDSRQQNNQLLI